MQDAEDRILERRLKGFLEKRQPPKTFCPSEVARALTKDDLAALGFSEWRDAMDSIRQVAWAMRERDECEILQKGQVLDIAGLEELKGPIRIRRRG